MYWHVVDNRVIIGQRLLVWWFCGTGYCGYVVPLFLAGKRQEGRYGYNKVFADRCGASVVSFGAGMFSGDGNALYGLPYVSAGDVGAGVSGAWL